MKVKRVDFMPGIKQREPAFGPQDGEEAHAGGMAYWLDDTKFHITYESGVILARRKGGTETRGYGPGIWGSFVADPPPVVAEPKPAQPAPQQGGRR